ncbi:hypothetical protein HanXRQr2_Chr11g0506071 [Helianthus annuus]|uniref:Uncharacterized protein n=1 Tax=Helianthus annuus TaxID=4232 RepID=A0A251TKJ2_HELAN|nr:hypothetical protein HanXRQr2_Chr11g0506071 [Helianthus annuus]KAJ0876376.1 hypothetical protein HanPSC8_Chr11g0487691 [Helianthus annuus]
MAFETLQFRVMQLGAGIALSLTQHVHKRDSLIHHLNSCNHQFGSLFPMDLDLLDLQSYLGLLVLEHPMVQGFQPFYQHLFCY